MKTKIKILIVWLFAAIWLSTNTAFAQFVKQIGGILNDATNSVLLDKNGNSYVSGNFTGTVNFNTITKTSNGNTQDCYVSKYDPGGNLLWVSQFGTLENEFVMNSFIDSQNNIYCSWGVSTQNGAYGIKKIENINGNTSWYFNINVLSPQVAGIEIPILDFKETQTTVRLLMNTDVTYVFKRYNSSDFLLSTNNFLPGLIYLELDKTTGAILNYSVFNYLNTYVSDAKFDNDSIVIGGYFTGSTQINSTNFIATNGTADVVGFLASLKINGSLNWIKQFNNDASNIIEEVVGINIDSSRIYFFVSKRFAPTFMTNQGYFNFYDKKFNTLSNNNSIGIISYVNGARFFTKKIKETILVNVVWYGTYFSNWPRIFVFNTGTLERNNSLINFPISTSINTRAFAFDSTYLYLVGDFIGSATLGTQTFTSLGSGTSDGFLWKSKYCFFPPEVSISAEKDSVCVNFPSVQLTGTPAGGTYSGNGVVGNTFFPSVSGIDIHEVMYEYTNSNGCTNTDTTMIYVDACTGIDINSNEFNISDFQFIGIYNVLGQYVSNDKSEILPTGIYLYVYKNKKDDTRYTEKKSIVKR